MIIEESAVQTCVIGGRCVNLALHSVLGSRHRQRRGGFVFIIDSITRNRLLFAFTRTIAAIFGLRQTLIVEDSIFRVPVSPIKRDIRQKVQSSDSSARTMPFHGNGHIIIADRAARAIEHSAVYRNEPKLPERGLAKARPRQDLEITPPGICRTSQHVHHMDWSFNRIYLIVPDTLANAQFNLCTTCLENWSWKCS